MRKIAAALGMSLICISGVAAAQPREADYRQFHLGMTLDEVRRLDSLIPAGPRQFVVPLVPVRISGLLFAVGVQFGQDGRADNIRFGGGSGMADLAACQAAFERVVTQIESDSAPLRGDRTPWDAAAPGARSTETPGGSQIRSTEIQPGAQRMLAYREDAEMLLVTTGRFGPPEARFAGSNPPDRCELHVALTSTPHLAPALDAPPDPPALQQAPLMEHPSWLQRPSGDRLAELFPILAENLGVDGRVSLDCLVGQGGGLNCAVSSETPQSWGFGDAARRLSLEFRAAPEIDGVSTTGKRVRLSIGFRQ